MKNHLRGISLIEALITLLVLSIGLLGLGQLQAHLWSSSGKLHATSNAYLLGTTVLEMLTAKRIIAPDLIADPPSQILRSGTLFNTTVSLSENEQFSEADIRVVWGDRSGSLVINLESITDTVSRAYDTRLLLPVDLTDPVLR
ncbi:MAG: hypothetical protein BMS9Abin08_1507 [Gammaproteobacteria bacterium]|nr:MAG: hypothetical protein BMS9Abin08_1507 [Gammaproteobacteria bacterium]